MNTIAAIQKNKYERHFNFENSNISNNFGDISHEILKYRDLLDEPLRSAFDHHFKKNGKLLRADLALRAAHSKHYTNASCVRWAASVELLHNASLVHDDVCDDDSERRGRASVAEMYGKEIAICLGDALIALSSFILASDHSLRHALAAQSVAILKLSTGQAAEFGSAHYPTWKAYEHLVEGKTTPLISLPVIGLTPNETSDPASERIIRYISEASVAFQMMNDIQNICHGKACGSPATDLKVLRPNAVIAKFYESLPEIEKGLFTRSKIAKFTPENYARIQFWWEKILLSDSLSVTRKLLGEKLERSQLILASLDDKNQEILEPFNKWLHKSYSTLSSQ